MTCACRWLRKRWFVLARLALCGTACHMLSTDLGVASCVCFPSLFNCTSAMISLDFDGIQNIPDHLTISSFARDISTKSHFRFAASFSGLFPTCWENSLQASETSCPVVDYDKHGIISGYSTQCVKEGTSCPCGKNSISCPDPNDAACHREFFSRSFAGT